MKIKPNSYYMTSVSEDICDFYYTNDIEVYWIALKNKNKIIHKHNTPINYGSIKKWQEHLDRFNMKLKEMSKGDLFLEML